MGYLTISCLKTTELTDNNKNMTDEQTLQQTYRVHRTAWIQCSACECNRTCGGNAYLLMGLWRQATTNTFLQSVSHLKHR